MLACVRYHNFKVTSPNAGSFSLAFRKGRAAGNSGRRLRQSRLEPPAQTRSGLANHATITSQCAARDHSLIII